MSGEWYTIVYAIRRPVGISLTIDHDPAVFALTLPADPLPTEDFEMRYIPFKAGGTDLSILLGSTATDIEIRYFAIYNGVGIPMVDVKPQPIVWSSAAPTVGTWIQGDEAKNQTATVGQPIGWRCTVAGTPGTWVAMANL